MKTNRYLLIGLALLLALSASGFADEKADLKAYNRYWKQVQSARNDYDDTVGAIQKKYPDADSNPKAQAELQKARQKFSTQRTKIESKNSAVAGNSDVEQKYWSKKHGTYKQKHDAAEKRFQSQMATIKKKYPNPAQNAVARRYIQRATKEYNNTSRQLAVAHQKDIQDMIRDEMGKSTKGGTHKTSAPEKTTAGTGIYKKDPNTGAILRDSSGKPVPNPNYRGFDGDYDGEAGSRVADPDKIQKILAKKGLGDVSVEDRPGYVTIGDGKDGINLTLNKAGESMGKPGSSGHDARVTVDAQSKETYVSAAMKKNQPGKAYVEVQDHKKKAMKGLQSDPNKLLNNPNALQGMAKGTSKSMQSSDMSDDEIRAIIKQNGLNDTPSSFRKKMADLKSGQAKAPQGVGIDESNIAKYQKASRDVIDAAEKKTAAQRDSDYEATQKKITKLLASNDPDDKKEAAELRKDLAGSRARSKATKTANERREAGEDLTPPPTTKRRTGGNTASGEDGEGKKKSDGVTTSAHSSRSEEGNLQGGTTTEEHSGKTTRKSDGSTVTTQKDKTTETGITGTKTSEKNSKTTKTKSGGTATKESSSETKTGLTGSETSDSTKTKVTTAGGTSKETSTTTTKKTGMTGSESSTTTSTTTTKADGSSKTSSKTDSETSGLVKGETQTSSRTDSSTDAKGDGTSTTTTKRNEKGSFGTGTSTTDTSTTKTKADGSESTTGQKSETSTIGGHKTVQKDTESSSSGQTTKVNVTDNDGNTIGKGSVKTETGTETETTTIGGKKVGTKTTKKGSITGKFDRDAPDEPDKPKSGPDIKIKIADNMKTDEKAHWGEKETGGATKVGDAELSGNIKIEAGHTKSQVGTSITIEKDGSVKVEGVYHKEGNLVRITGGGKATGKVGDVGFTTEAKGEFKVGGNLTVKGDVSAGPDGVKAHAEFDVFAGMKAEGEISGEIDLKDLVGISVKGTMKGEVSVGVGAKGSADAEISFTKVKISAALAASLGIGTGGSATVEVDISVLTTGVDLSKVAATTKSQGFMGDVIKKVKTGQMKLPPGKTWSDIREELQKKAEWLTKYPQLVKPGKEADAIMKDMGFEKGKNHGKYVNVKKRQKDWYCTNRPEIKAPVDIPNVVISWKQRMKNAGLTDD